MPSAAGSFASRLLAELRRRDPLARALQYRARGKAAVIGIEDAGEFLPLLKLDAAAAAFNVMSLFVYHHRSWKPTFQRGTPALLADSLSRTFRHLWAIPAAMAEPLPWEVPEDPAPLHTD